MHCTQIFLTMLSYTHSPTKILPHILPCRMHMIFVDYLAIISPPKKRQKKVHYRCILFADFNTQHGKCMLLASFTPDMGIWKRNHLVYVWGKKKSFCCLDSRLFLASCVWNSQQCILQLPRIHLKHFWDPLSIIDKTKYSNVNPCNTDI
jgi:hypothetical protein